MASNLASLPVLYLDYDGVLHPDSVVWSPKTGIRLEAAGSLFMHAEILATHLIPYPELVIVLSTSWVKSLGYRRALKHLPEALRRRTCGATWHSTMAQELIIEPYATSYNRFDTASRYQQIVWHVLRHGIRNWIAIDDLHSGIQKWPQEHEDRLILTDCNLGLGSRLVQEELKKKLELHFGYLQ